MTDEAAGYDTPEVASVLTPTALAALRESLARAKATQMPRCGVFLRTDELAALLAAHALAERAEARFKRMRAQRNTLHAHVHALLRTDSIDAHCPEWHAALEAADACDPERDDEPLPPPEPEG